MTQDELRELVSHCPVLFHMAEANSWPSIEQHGLLSATALLDLYEVTGKDRENLERKHRPEIVTIENEKIGSVAKLRDQIPMSDSGLERCLPEGSTPADWYLYLNRRTFFWLTEERLNRLLGAKAYREKEHDVLEVDTASLVSDYAEKITLSPINSGCTKPFPHPRDFNLFKNIADYPYDNWAKKRPKGERVVELAVDYGVEDISRYIRRVTRRRGKEVIDTIFQKEP